MARPQKKRKICHFPHTLAFFPAGEEQTNDPILLTVDEYEALRLIDREGLSQEQCCEFMNIARTTVQRIYESARKKLADMLVEGRPLKIEGGDFDLCSGEGPCCGKNCFMRHYSEKYSITKGETEMRIAATYDNGNIFQHFGRTSEFKVYDVEDGKVVSAQVVSTGGSGHSALAGILTALKADVLICGGIGGGAQAALNAAGIRFYAGVSGNADAAVNALLTEKLDFDPNAKCDHHDHQHGHEHTCGEHGCGSHGHEHTCGHHK